MTVLRINYYYPSKKEHRRYSIIKDEIFVTEENIIEFVSEPNIIDQVCDAMKLVLFEKYSNKELGQDVISFFRDLDKFNDLANKHIIYLFAEGKSYETKDIDYLGYTYIESESLRLAFIFKDIWEKKQWRK